MGITLTSMGRGLHRLLSYSAKAARTPLVEDDELSGQSLRKPRDAGSTAASANGAYRAGSGRFIHPL
ncbi:hypothetical protein ACKC9G_13420 [Pokkaliibacter sp. CJK22405]|uniref:hypothetical protein n=1 Tax=Pokkaliibacter sp. CJK22405 TaxID=3384615 RepID=UPI0039851F36